MFGTSVCSLFVNVCFYADCFVVVYSFVLIVLLSYNVRGFVSRDAFKSVVTSEGVYFEM